MSRYFTIPQPQSDDDPYWLYSGPLLPSLHVPDHHPVNTGLVDKNGSPIMRAPHPCGFHIPKPKERA